MDGLRQLRVVRFLCRGGRQLDPISTSPCSYPDTRPSCLNRLVNLMALRRKTVNRSRLTLLCDNYVVNFTRRFHVFTISTILWHSTQDVVECLICSYFCPHFNAWLRFTSRVRRICSRAAGFHEAGRSPHRQTLTISRSNLDARAVYKGLNAL
jgi:hypothetical protein